MDSPIKRHGGKHYTKKWIGKHIARARQLFPIKHFVEPFFGAGSVTLETDISDLSVVVNDKDFLLTNFWKVLQSELLFAEFKRVVEATPVSRVEFCESVYDLELRRIEQANAQMLRDPSVPAAVDFFIECRQSRQALGKSFTTLSKSRTRRGVNEAVSSWLTAIEGLPQVHDFLKRIVIECDDFEALIRREDSPNTLFYLDPPYLHETRTAKDCYEYEMSDKDHERLLLSLADIKGRFLLSGYRSGMYDTAARLAGWSMDSIAIDNKASSSDTKETKLECLWMNF